LISGIGLAALAADWPLARAKMGAWPSLLARPLDCDGHEPSLGQSSLWPSSQKKIGPKISVALL